MRNNTTEVCESTELIVELYVIPVFGFSNCALNLICMSVLFNPKIYISSNVKMFKYLLVKSALDTIFSFFDIFNIFFFCSSCPISNTYSIQILSFIMRLYLRSVLVISSFLVELIAHIYCLVNISKRILCINNINFKYLLILTIGFSSAIYIFRFFSYEIKQNEEDSSYKIQKRNSNRELFEYLEFSISILRNLILMLIIIILNSMIGMYYRKSLCIKRRLSSLVREESKILQMNLAFGFVTVLTRFLIVLKYIPTDKLNSNCMASIAAVAYRVGLIINTMIFYHYNKIFRKTLNTMITGLIRTK